MLGRGGRGEVSILAATPVPAVMIEFSRPTRTCAASRGNQHLSQEFATTWPTYDLAPETRALLAYTKKLTEAPAAVSDADLDSLRNAG